MLGTMIHVLSKNGPFSEKKNTFIIRILNRHHALGVTRNSQPGDKICPEIYDPENELGKLPMFKAGNNILVDFPLSC